MRNPSQAAPQEVAISLRYVRELTAAERAELTELYKSSPVADVVRRSHAVLLSADGWAVPKIAALLRVNQATIHRWLDWFEAAGSAGLPTQWSDGRPPAWDEAYEWLLVETVRHDPRWYRAGAVVVDLRPAGPLLGDAEPHHAECRTDM